MMNLGRQSPSAAHWSRQQYENPFVTNDSHSSERFMLVVEDAYEVRGETEGEAHQIIAFLVAHRVEMEWELENIVVAEKFQRRGVGTRLLSEFIAHARAANGSGIFLEVRQSNQNARALYRRAGFEETGSRKGYYAGPSEDAIVYRFGLC